MDFLAQIDTQYAHGDSISKTCHAESLFDQVMAETNHDDQLRRMDWCIELWTRGINEARALQSQQRFDDAHQAYIAMCAAWPGEKRVKDLCDYLAH